MSDAQRAASQINLLNQRPGGELDGRARSAAQVIVPLDQVVQGSASIRFASIGCGSTCFSELMRLSPA
jgi:hypothetical protein